MFLFLFLKLKHHKSLLPFVQASRKKTLTVSNPNIPTRISIVPNNTIPKQWGNPEYEVFSIYPTKFMENFMINVFFSHWEDFDVCKPLFIEMYRYLKHQLFEQSAFSVPK